MPRYTVNMDLQDPDSEDEQFVSWSGEADDEGQAVDLAREELDPDDIGVISEVFEEEG